MAKSLDGLWAAIARCHRQLEECARPRQGLEAAELKTATVIDGWRTARDGVKVRLRAVAERLRNMYALLRSTVTSVFPGTGNTLSADHRSMASGWMSVRRRMRRSPQGVWGARPDGGTSTLLAAASAVGRRGAVRLRRPWPFALDDDVLISRVFGLRRGMADRSAPVLSCGRSAPSGSMAESALDGADPPVLRGMWAPPVSDFRNMLPTHNNVNPPQEPQKTAVHSVGHDGPVG